MMTKNENQGRGTQAASLASIFTKEKLGLRPEAVTEIQKLNESIGRLTNDLLRGMPMEVGAIGIAHASVEIRKIIEREERLATLSVLHTYLNYSANIKQKYVYSLRNELNSYFKKEYEPKFDWDRDDHYFVVFPALLERALKFSKGKLKKAILNYIESRNAEYEAWKSIPGYYDYFKTVSEYIADDLHRDKHEEYILLHTVYDGSKFYRVETYRPRWDY